MSVRRFAMLLVATALLGAGASAVQAAPAITATPITSTKPLDFTVQADSSPVAPGTQTLKWDAAKSHWGVTFSMQQPETRSTTLNDIQAGAYYKITPALRVGGAFAFGQEQALTPGPKTTGPDAGQPRVQLETKFKF